MLAGDQEDRLFLLLSAYCRRCLQHDVEVHLIWAVGNPRRAATEKKVTMHRNTKCIPIGGWWVSHSRGITAGYGFPQLLPLSKRSRLIQKLISFYDKSVTSGVILQGETGILERHLSAYGMENRMRNRWTDCSHRLGSAKSGRGIGSTRLVTQTAMVMKKICRAINGGGATG